MRDPNPLSSRRHDTAAKGNRAAATRRRSFIGRASVCSKATPDIGSKDAVLQGQQSPIMG